MQAAATSVAGKYVKIAVKNRREIQIAEEQVRLTKLRILTAARSLGPSILFQYRESDGKTMDDPYHSQSYSVKASQSVFMGLKKYYSLKKELESLKVAKNEKRKLQQEVKFNAVKSYYTALLNSKKLKNTQELIEDSEKEFIVSKKKYSVKIITQLEYLEVKDLKKEMIIQKEVMENELNLSVLDLKKTCGMNFKIPINLSDDILEKEADFMELTLDKYKAMALKNRPEINAYKALVFQTEYDEKISKAERWPGISVEGSVGKGGEAYVDQDLALASEWSVYANLQWLFWGSSLGAKYGKKRTEPSEILDFSVKTETEDRIVQLSILDRLDYYYGKQEKKVIHQQAKKELEETRRKVIMEVEKSYYNLRLSVKMIELAGERVELNEKKVAIIEKRKFLGEATSKDLIEAKMKVVQQKNALSDAICRYNISLAELKASSGIDVYPVR